KSTPSAKLLKPDIQMRLRNIELRPPPCSVRPEILPGGSGGPAMQAETVAPIVGGLGETFQARDGYAPPDCCLSISARLCLPHHSE
ncbi:MAG TPA: hypothetical protein VGM03_09975, partial [Phycisphaerae bacterium]